MPIKLALLMILAEADLVFGGSSFGGNLTMSGYGSIQ